MKKYIFAIIIIMSLVFAGCSTDSSKVNSSKDTNKVPEALSGNHNEYTTLDSLKVISVSNFALMRDGEMYQMGDVPPDEDLGIKEAPNAWGKLCYETIDSNFNKNLLSVHNLPVPIIRENDKFYVYKTYTNINVKPLNFVGYSPFFTDNRNGHMIVGDQNRIVNANDDCSDFSVQTKDGQKIKKEDIRKLAYGQEVQISYSSKHQTSSCNLKADCAYYEYSGGSVVLEPIGTEKIENSNYTIYDPTKLEKGFYVLCENNTPRGVFVIQ